MSLPVVLLRAARVEFNEAVAWHDHRRTGLGAELTVEIDRAIAMASTSPQQFAVISNDTRCVRVWRFTYSVFFRAETPQIVVFAIFMPDETPPFGSGESDDPTGLPAATRVP
jgi:hypothetical protein